ncbi:hypothetical protein I6A60_20335 [Frankia sp. AgB1.9]|uniref:hypothetical protein n=1 Tax=unclassified Frankia TaxID=2632575 RepID=UPI00193312FE|nr:MULTISPECIES: hypothetical protein [unclassified Frankia]MBL7491921.1 hypothetical protein [Frankia sp. AgW1.1]MBL7550210.1 hypothetical protein [Frankia sp. AgB1.9]MBL7619869.1 hypothetical protein [Frankia sp. AgB1.8]
MRIRGRRDAVSDELGRLRARGYAPAGRGPAGMVGALARVVLDPGPGDPGVTVGDLADGLALCAAARVAGATADGRLEGWQTRLVRAARTGAPGRSPMSWTQIASALGEPLGTVMAHYPHLIIDPRTGPTKREEAAAARAAGELP